MTDADASNRLPLALLVLDMQEVFLRAMPDEAVCLRRTEFAIRAARLLDIPVLFTEQVPEKVGSTTQALLDASDESPEVFPKTAFSALRAEGFEARLEELECEHLLLTGIEIPICIYQTCLDAVAAGRAITVLGDCVTGRRPEDFAMVREALTRSDVHWLPSETVFYSILGDAEHPQFKAYTKLVKTFHANTST